MATSEHVRQTVDVAIEDALAVRYVEDRNPGATAACDLAGQILLGASRRFQHIDSYGNISALVAVAPKAGGPERAIIQLRSSGLSTDFGMHWLAVALDSGTLPIERISLSGFTGGDLPGAVYASVIAGPETYNDIHPLFHEGKVLPVQARQFGRDFDLPRQTRVLADFVAFAGACVVDQELTDRCGATLGQLLTAKPATSDQAGEQV